MATQTLGTNSATSLTAVVFSQATTALLPADLAAINAAILDDLNPSHPVAQLGGMGGFVREGLLYVPNRGFLRVLPGDVVAVDGTSGQPILLTAYGLSAGPWTLT